MRRVLRNQDKLRSKKLADALLADKSRNFCQEVKQFKAGKQNCSHTVDGITDDENLVKLWSSKFKSVLSSPDPVRALQLANTLYVSSKDLESLVISEDVVLAAVGKLKCGKSEGGSLSSDHLMFAPSEFLLLFSQLCYVTVTCLLCLEMQLSSQSQRVETTFYLLLST